MGSIVCAASLFALLNLTAPGAAPINQLLREILSSLQFTLDHPLDNLKAIDQTTASSCAVSPVADFTALYKPTETY